MTLTRRSRSAEPLAELAERRAAPTEADRAGVAARTWPRSRKAMQPACPQTTRASTRRDRRFDPLAERMPRPDQADRPAVQARRPRASTWPQELALTRKPPSL